MTTEALRSRVGETEYVQLDPRYTRPSRFGDFYSHPDFPDRYDANQLCRVRCSAGEVREMLHDLESLYSPGFEYRKVSGYSVDVWSHLAPDLSHRGWGVWTTRLLLHRAESVKKSNTDVAIVTVPATSPDLASFYRTESGLDRGFEMARGQAARVGGEYVVGYLDGQPAGCTGWFSIGGIARFRHVFTAPAFRGRGVATSLIHYLQHHPEVEACDELAILVGEDGPGELYERLGFREAMLFWEAKHPPR